MNGDACYDRGSSFRLKCFLNDGAAQPKIVGNRIFLFMILAVYLGHGIFHPVAGLIFLQISFWERS